MKGILEEYGMFAVGGIIAMVIISTLLISTLSPAGEIREFFISAMKNIGAVYIK